MVRRFSQVDTFTSVPLMGNPVAVVLDGEGLTTDEMQRFARWTNLSETTFVLPPADPKADYRVRVFMPNEELPFAGHPTLGTCHAWLAASPSDHREIVQECAAGLVPVRRTDAGLAFAAPPIVDGGELDEPRLEQIGAMLGIDRAEMVDAQWAQNGPRWVAVLLESADAVLALEPRAVDCMIGVVGPYSPGGPAEFEVRAFFPKDGSTVEDPVTGSLNALLADWLLRSGRAAAPYAAAQGERLGRAGRVQISRDEDGQIWVGGGTVTCIDGTAAL